MFFCKHVRLLCVINAYLLTYLQYYSGPPDTDNIIKVMGSIVKVTVNIVQKWTFSVEAYRSKVHRQRPSTFW